MSTILGGRRLLDCCASTAVRSVGGRVSESRWVPGLRFGPEFDPEQYELLEFHHRGGEAEVWRAVRTGHNGIKELVAAKIMLERDPSEVRRWLGRWDDVSHNAHRLGVTDLCSAYGLRRSPDLTAYDVALVAAVIGDVVNVLGRADGTGYTVTGPVWEYFPVQERMFKPQLRRTPFAASAGTARASGEEVRRRIIEHDLDGLIREVELDRTNGLLGKTCIHPSHVPAVHALSVVTHEEYCDARDILRQEQDGGGVLRSAYTNKMNEVRPHRAWAERVLLRAEVFGVAREDVSFAELLSACLCG